MRKRVSGFTKIELIAVVSILGILIAMTMPALQRARESMRRTTCTNNLRQVGLAIQSYESSMRQLPSLYNGSFRANPPTVEEEFHCYSWRVSILPQLEQSAMFAKIDPSLPATEVSNQSWINSELAVFQCPSTSTPNRYVPDIQSFNKVIPADFVIVGTAARSDYEIIGGAGIHASVGKRPPYLSTIEFGAWGEPAYRYEGNTIVPVSYRTAKFRDISDGLSNTMLVAERSARPDWYKDGRLYESWPYSGNRAFDNHQAAWAISTHFAFLAPHNGRVNHDNMSGIYSFHDSGANCLFADGSVQFVGESADSEILNAWSTRSNRESVQHDWQANQRMHVSRRTKFIEVLDRSRRPRDPYRSVN